MNRQDIAERVTRHGSFSGFTFSALVLLAGVAVMAVLGSGPAPKVGSEPSPSPAPAAVAGEGR